MEREAAPGKANCRKETKTGGTKDLHFMYVLNWFGREPNRKNSFPCSAGTFPHHSSIVRRRSPAASSHEGPSLREGPDAKRKFRAEVCRQRGGGLPPAPTVSCTQAGSKHRFLPRCPQV